MARGFLDRLRARGRALTEEGPGRARRAVEEVSRTANAAGEILDERSGGRLGEAVGRGRTWAGDVGRAPGEAREAFRDEAAQTDYRPDPYRPDPIDAPAPIDRPDPV